MHVDVQKCTSPYEIFFFNQKRKLFHGNKKESRKTQAQYINYLKKKVPAQTVQ